MGGAGRDRDCEQSGWVWAWCHGVGGGGEQGPEAVREQSRHLGRNVLDGGDSRREACDPQFLP